jgi:hypothetical protein
MTGIGYGDSGNTYLASNKTLGGPFQRRNGCRFSSSVRVNDTMLSGLEHVPNTSLVLLPYSFSFLRDLHINLFPIFNRHVNKIIPGSVEYATDCFS